MTEADYDIAIERAGRAAIQLEAELDHNRKRIQQHYGNLPDLPDGRRATFLRNTSPAMLLALSYSLMRQSFSQRFTSTRRSLELASLAHEIAELVREKEYLSAEVSADLQAEALLYLGNAKRLNSDLVGASRTLAEAGRRLEEGTGDRYLKADHAGMMAALFSGQGQCEEAAALFDREIALRRLLGDTEKSGIALVNRGSVACWAEGPTRSSCDLLRRGVERVSDKHTILVALHTLAEALARDCKGLEAWKVMWTAGLVLASLDDPIPRLRRGWIEGIIYRSTGELGSAERTLSSVRDGFLEQGMPFQASLASLDLACVFAAQGCYRELRQLVQEAYAVFSAERLERRALAAVLMLREAAEKESASEELAIAVANFLVRLQHNRKAHFEWPHE